MKKFVKILSLSLVAVMLLAMLASCAPASDPGKAVEALKAEGYTALRDNNVIPAAFKLAGYSLDVVVTGTKTIKDKDGKKTVESVTIFYFANKEDAEKAFDKVKDKEKDSKEDSEESNWVSATKSGKMVYFGTKQAIKDAR